MKTHPSPSQEGVRSIRKKFVLIFKTIDMRMILSFNCQNTIPQKKQLQCPLETLQGSTSSKYKLGSYRGRCLALILTTYPWLKEKLFL
jgi:hypothetical protein